MSNSRIGSYPITSLTINGNDIARYRVVYSADATESVLTAAAQLK